MTACTPLRVTFVLCLCMFSSVSTAVCRGILNAVITAGFRIFLDGNPAC
jgi:hypothetical protein